MQSVRAGAVQTHFFILTRFLKNSSYMTSFGVHFGGSFHKKLQFLVKKKGSKKWIKKRVPALTQTSPYDHGPGLPDSPPRVRGFLNKKQLSEQETRTGAHF